MTKRKIGVLLKGIEFPCFMKILYRNSEVLIGPINDMKIINILQKIKKNKSQITLHMSPGQDQFFITENEKTIIIFDFEFQNYESIFEEIKKFLQLFLNINQFIFNTHLHPTKYLIFNTEKNQKIQLERFFFFSPNKQNVFLISRKNLGISFKNYENVFNSIYKKIDSSPYLKNIFENFIHEFIYGITSNLVQNKIGFSWNFIEHITTSYWNLKGRNFTLKPPDFENFLIEINNYLEKDLIPRSGIYPGLSYDSLSAKMVKTFKEQLSSTAIPVSRSFKKELKNKIEEIISSLHSKSILLPNYTKDNLKNLILNQINNWPPILKKLEELYKILGEDMPDEHKYLNFIRNKIYHESSSIDNSIRKMNARYRKSLNISDLLKNYQFICSSLIYSLLEMTNFKINISNGFVKSLIFHLEKSSSVYENEIARIDKLIVYYSSRFSPEISSIIDIVLNIQNIEKKMYFKNIKCHLFNETENFSKKIKLQPDFKLNFYHKKFLNPSIYNIISTIPMNIGNCYYYFELEIVARIYMELFFKEKVTGYYNIIRFRRKKNQVFKLFPCKIFFIRILNICLLKKIKL